MEWVGTVGRRGSRSEPDNSRTAVNNASQANPSMAVREILKMGDPRLLRIAEPVREFTIASTLQRMLLDIVEVGGDVDWLPMRAAGVSLVVNDVTMSGA